jgi:bacterioferritin (cytochrome b1)
MSKEEIVKMLNQALELEHAAYIQYLSHAEIPDGIDSEAVVERLKEIASDEKDHAEKFRELIGAFLGGVPSMGVAPTKKAGSVKEILETNLKDEMEAVDIYTGIMKKIAAEKDSLPYEFLRLEHDLRHVIMDEMEHISEIKQLLGK